MARHAILSKAESHALILRAQAGDAAALARLVECNQGLVTKIARGWVRQRAGRMLEDCVQDGNIGLMHAIKRFDVSRNLALSTFATHWIRQAIQRAEVDTGHMVRLPAHRVAKGMQHAVVMSLDAPVDGERGGRSFADVQASDEPGPHEVAEESEQGARLREALADLGWRHRTILRMRYGVDCEPRTLAEIGEDLGLSRERIRQVEVEALRALKAALRRRAGRRWQRVLRRMLAVPWDEVPARTADGWSVGYRPDGRTAYHGEHGVWMERMA